MEPIVVVLVIVVTINTLLGVAALIALMTGSRAT
jgi:hypothetical protein